MIDHFDDDENQWTVPDDRQLALRGKLGTGWSTICINTGYKKHITTISEAERDYVITVLRRNEYIQIQEQYRIGTLVTRFEHTKKNIHGDGVVTCLICGTKPGMFRDLLHFCGICGHLVCPKCSLEYRSTCDILYACVICNEGKVLWKRSGAWFYKTMPKYFLPGEVIESQAHHRIPSRPSQSSLGSDDSDGIEHASTFELPEETFSLHYSDINTMEESQSIASFTTNLQREGNVETISSSSLSSDEIKRDKKYTLSRETSITSSDSSTKETHISEEKESNNNLGSISAPTDSVVETAEGIFRKMSRIISVNSNDNLKNLKESDKGQNDNDSINDVKDIDALFTSFERQKEREKEKESEYTGHLGKIKFTLQFDPNTQDLLIVIDSCNGLKFGEKTKDVIPSAYVKSILLPVQVDSVKSSKKRTPTVKKTSDPVYNFCIVYPGISTFDIERKGIQLSVIDETNFSNKYTIGETCIALKGLTDHPIQQFRRILDARAQIDSLFLDVKKVESNAGRIEVSLHYISKQEKLVVGIIRCVGLKALDPNGYSDPFVKCYLLPDAEKRTKQKTSIKKKTLNPEFNEEFHFEISHSELAQKSLYLAVWDYDVGRSNDFIGELRLGIESKGEGLHHWFETLKSSDKRFIRWHDLNNKMSIT